MYVVDEYKKILHELTKLTLDSRGNSPPVLQKSFKTLQPTQVLHVFFSSSAVM